MLPGKIEEVGVPLLEYFLEEVKDVFVFLYDEDDARSLKLLKGLEEVNRLNCLFGIIYFHLSISNIDMKKILQNSIFWLD